MVIEWLDEFQQLTSSLLSRLCCAATLRQRPWLVISVVCSVVIQRSIITLPSSWPLTRGERIIHMPFSYKQLQTPSLSSGNSESNNTKLSNTAKHTSPLALQNTYSNVLTMPEPENWIMSIYIYIYIYMVLQVISWLTNFIRSEELLNFWPMGKLY
jgi:hypothetical protein